MIATCNNLQGKLDMGKKFLGLNLASSNSKDK